jgi:hypothetical protein
MRVRFTPHVLGTSPEELKTRRYELDGYRPGLDRSLCFLIEKLVDLPGVENAWFDSVTANLYVTVSYTNVWSEGCSPQPTVFDWFENPAALLAA